VPPPEPRSDPEELLKIRRRLAILAVVLATLGSIMVLVVALDAGDAADAVGHVGGVELIVLALAIAALSLVFTPAALLCAAAGYVAGAAEGTVAALVGLSLGAMGCAAIARLVGTPQGAPALGRRAERLANWISVRPLRSIAVARLIPGVPFHLVSYVSGLTNASLLSVGAGTALGFAPRGFLFTVLGGTIGDLDRPETRVAAILSVVLLVAFAVIGNRRWAGRGPL